MPDIRKASLNVYLRDDEKSVLKAAAEADGMMLASWARRTLLKAAKQETTNADHD